MFLVLTGRNWMDWGDYMDLDHACKLF
jgi:hypothetical protein